MKTLNTYLESLLDDEDSFTGPERDIEIVRLFLNSIYGLEERDYEIIKSPPKSKAMYIVNIPDDVCYLEVQRKDIKQLTNGMFELGKVAGPVEISNCPNLESLEGCPREVGRWFDVINCPNLKFLKGSPDTIHEVYTITKCNNIKKT